MNLNFAAILHCRNVNRVPLDDQASLEGKPFCVPPNLACMWADRHRTGAICEPLDLVPARNGGHSTLFHAKWTMREIRRSTIQSVLQQSKKPKKICNSIKIHFFSKSLIDGGKEEKRDFLYSAAFPLETLGKSGGRFGVFCVGITADEIFPLKGVFLDIIPVAPHPWLLPPGATIMLRPVFCAPEEHHKRIFKLAFFFRDVLVGFRPETSTLFVNFRSIFRDRASSWFFQDIYKLFQTKGSCLPATVAVYAMCNALMINAIQAQAFLDLLQKYDALFSRQGGGLSKEDLETEQLVLHIIRAVVACFTMCCFEGRYWFDRCGSVDVEDQPFPMTFMEPEDRVFPKDDCEGRAAQVQQMVDLLISLYEARESIGLQRLTALILKMPSSALLHVSRTTFLKLVDCCCQVGYLLKFKAAEVHTAVGEAQFKSFKKVRKSNGQTTKKEEIGGHSFSMAFSGTGRTQCIIETTGWERSAFHGEAQLCYNGNIQEQLLETLNPQERMQLLLESRAINQRIVNTQDVTDIDIENSMYQTIYMTHDYIFFTFTLPGQSPIYGAKLQTMRKNGIKTFDSANTTRFAPGDAFRIKTRDFILQMTRNHKDDSLWGPVEGAEDMLREYDLVQKELLQGRKCLRPPPKEEPQMEKIMLERWGAIAEDAHMKPMISSNHPRPDGKHSLIFSIGKDSRLTEDLTKRTLIQKAGASRVLTYPFMGSRIFCAVF